MTQKPVRVLVADPPWQFRDRLPGPKRGAAKHYKTMTTRDLAEFPLPSLAKDCVLFLWRVASMQEDAMWIANAWGFRIKTELVWLKKTKTGKRHFGMGHTLRAEHETCLVCTLGKPKVKNRSVRSTFDAPVGRHSQKPDAFYAIVESLFAGPYAELFARRKRKGWQCYGDELDGE